MKCWKRPTTVVRRITLCLKMFAFFIQLHNMHSLTSWRLEEYHWTRWITVQTAQHWNSQECINLCSVFQGKESRIGPGAMEQFKWEEIWISVKTAKVVCRGNSFSRLSLSLLQLFLKAIFSHCHSHWYLWVLLLLNIIGTLGQNWRCFFSYQYRVMQFKWKRIGISVKLVICNTFYEGMNKQI